ncbi:MAG: S8 family peptidase [Bacteroidota bacterium]|nr:S8 family peptidase [Bacteroidota bacterium]
MKRLLLLILLLLPLTELSAQSKMNFALAKKSVQSDNSLIDVFVKGDISVIRELVQLHQGVFKYASGSIAAVKIPSSALSDFARNKKIERLEAYPPSFQPMNDTMLMHNNVIPVHTGQSPLTQPYDGTGIVVGFLDTGIDFTHPDFKDSLGKSRIKYLWDQTLPIAANTPMPYNYGQEWDNLGIDSGAASAHTDLAFSGHGTHVAGIGVGNGLATGTYKGVAPKADIIMVAIDFYSSSSSLITDGVDYIYSKALAMGKPCVINASLGDYYGSHDGMDLQAQLISSMINASTGRSFVAATGNGGNFPYHLGYSVTSDTNFTFFSNPPNDIYLQMWADTNDLKNVDFSIGADQMSPVHSFRGRIPFSDISSHLGVLLADTLYNAGNRIGIIESYGDLSGGVYSMEFHIIPDSTSYNWRLITTGSGKFDLWNFDVVSGTLPSLASMPDSSFYKQPDTDKTIVSSFNCLDNVISVANFTNRKSYIDYNNNLFVIPTNVPGKRHITSSIGPTRDGRIKPDIASPGDLTVAAVVLSLVPAIIAGAPDVLAQGGYHVRNGGSSHSCPGVAGTAALYLQKNPTATAMDVKNAIIDCATQDSFTGNSLPDNYWGYGKVNAFTALTGCLSVATEEIPVAQIFNLYPNPTHAGEIIQFSFNGKFTEKTEINIYNSTGSLVLSKALTGTGIQLPESLSGGIYYCILSSGNEIIAKEKMIILRP